MSSRADPYSHLQDEGVAAGGFVRVDQAHYVGVLEPLQQVEFLSHPVPPHQLLVHLFDRHQTLDALLVTSLHHGETAPGETVAGQRSDLSLRGHLTQQVKRAAARS